jgi:hypothetical protein
MLEASGRHPVAKLEMLAAKTERKKTIVGAALLLATATVVAVVSLRGPDAETKAIKALSEPERRALFGRTLRTLETTCDQTKRPRGLDDFCREQAEFVLKFPECDAACSRRAAQFRPLPTR